MNSFSSFFFSFTLLLILILTIVTTLITLLFRMLTCFSAAILICCCSSCPVSFLNLNLRTCRKLINICICSLSKDRTIYPVNNKCYNRICSFQNSIDWCSSIWIKVSVAKNGRSGTLFLGKRLSYIHTFHFFSILSYRKLIFFYFSL